MNPFFSSVSNVTLFPILFLYKFFAIFDNTHKSKTRKQKINGPMFEYIDL